MNLNITKLKAALIEAGHVVSEGEQWLLSDLTELEHFAFRVYGIAKDKLHYGLSYVSLLPSHFPGHPDAEDAAEAAAPAAVAAPVEPEAPMAAQEQVQEQPQEQAPEAPVEEAPTAEEQSAEAPAESDAGEQEHPAE